MGDNLFVNPKVTIAIIVLRCHVLSDVEHAVLLIEEIHLSMIHKVVKQLPHRLEISPLLGRIGCVSTYGVNQFIIERKHIECNKISKLPSIA